MLLLSLVTNATSTSPVKTWSSVATAVDVPPSVSVQSLTSISDGSLPPSLARASVMNAPYGLPLSVVMSLVSEMAVLATSPDLALSVMPTGCENEIGSLPHAATASRTKTSLVMSRQCGARAQRSQQSILAPWWVVV